MHDLLLCSVMLLVGLGIGWALCHEFGAKVSADMAKLDSSVTGEVKKVETTATTIETDVKKI